MASLGDMFRGAVAQLNPFDGGKDYKSETKKLPSQGAPGGAFGKAATTGARAPSYLNNQPNNAIPIDYQPRAEDDGLVQGPQGFVPQNADVGHFQSNNFNTGPMLRELLEDATLTPAQRDFPGRTNYGVPEDNMIDTPGGYITREQYNQRYLNR